MWQQLHWGTDPVIEFMRVTIRVAKWVWAVLGIAAVVGLQAADKTTPVFPVRGLCIAAPQAAGVERFVKFIEDELAPRGANTLILRVDWNYQYQSHPELRGNGAL